MEEEGKRERERKSSLLSYHHHLHQDHSMETGQLNPREKQNPKLICLFGENKMEFLKMKIRSKVKR